MVPNYAEYDVASLRADPGSLERLYTYGDLKLLARMIGELTREVADLRAKLDQAAARK